MVVTPYVNVTTHYLTQKNLVALILDAISWWMVHFGGGVSAVFDRSYWCFGQRLAPTSSFWECSGRCVCLFEPAFLYIFASGSFQSLSLWDNYVPGWSKRSRGGFECSIKNGRNYKFPSPKLYAKGKLDKRDFISPKVDWIIFLSAVCS